MGMRAALYTRVSTQRQRKEGLSLEQQREILMAHAVTKAWQMDGLYQDGGFSAGSLNRPAMQRLLADAKAKKFDVVLALDQSRLTRNVGDLQTLRAMLKKAGVQLVALNLNAEDTATGRGIQNLLAAVDQMQRELVAERIRLVVQRQRERREAWGRTPPFGFTRQFKTLVEDEAEMRTLREIIRLHRLGFSLREIILRLTKRGLKSRSGKPWAPKVVWQIIKHAEPEGMYSQMGLTFSGRQKQQ